MTAPRHDLDGGVRPDRDLDCAYRDYRGRGPEMIALVADKLYS